MKNSTTQKTFKNIGFAVLLFCAAMFSSLHSFAADQSKKIREENLLSLQKIESYLNNIHNLSAKFIQKSPDGTLAEGKFLLARNPSSAGKMRVEYSAQPKIIIVVNGSVLSYLDVELDEVSHLSTNTTPASFLTRPNISFAAKDVEITDFKNSGETTKVSVMKKNRKEAGEFSLIFKNNPLEFVKMEVKNDLGQVVEVTLSSVDLSSPIADQMFVIRNKILQ